jgi:hypothetical protein
MASREQIEGRQRPTSDVPAEWADLVRRSCEPSRALEWKIVLLDGEHDRDDSRTFYAQLVEALAGELGRNQNDIRLARNTGELERLDLSLDDTDIIFIGVPASPPGPKRFENIFTVLPRVRERRQLTPFPLVIALTRVTDAAVASYVVAQGVDFCIDRAALDSGSADLRMTPGELIRELVGTALAFRDWKFDREKYLARLSAPDLPEDFVEGDDFFATDERRYLLLKLVSHLPNVTRVLVSQRLSRGYSGAAFVGVVYPVQEGGSRLLPRVVKVDRKERLVYEKSNYDRHIVGNIDNFCGRVEPVVAVAESAETHSASLAAISYTAVGIREDYERSEGISDFDVVLCKAYLEPSFGLPDESILEKIDFLYSKILKPLHRPHHAGDAEVAVSDLSAYYRGYLRPQLELSFESSAETAKARDVSAATRNSRVSFFGDDRCVVEYIAHLPQGISLTVRQKRSNAHLRLFVPEKHRAMFDTVLLRRGKEIEFTARVTRTLRDVFDEKMLEVIETFDTGAESRNRKLADIPGRATESVAGDLFLDPLALFGDAESGARALSRTSGRLRVSIVHGDLHPRNVMYTPSTDALWLIDFARTGLGHTGIDFAIPEVYIRLNLMAKIVCREIDLKHDRRSPAYLAEFIQRVSRLEASFLKVGHDPVRELDEQNERVLRLLRPIFQIRKNALLEAECGIVEYLFSLYFCALKAFCFDFDIRGVLRWREAIDPYPRFYVYAFAGVLCRRLREMGQF